MYTQDAEAAINRADYTSRQRYPLDPMYRLSYEVGMLRGELRALASQAQVDSQMNMVARRIARLVDLPIEDALELLDAISAALVRKYPEDKHTITEALAEATLALADVGSEDER